jgi:hypothetical protein
MPEFRLMEAAGRLVREALALCELCGRIEPFPTSLHPGVDQRRRLTQAGRSATSIRGTPQRDASGDWPTRDEAMHMAESFARLSDLPTLS